MKIKDENGIDQSVIMGSYGIGLGRLMGTIVEVLSDESGIIWPESVAPFKVHLLSLGTDPKVLSEAKKLYDLLISKNIEVLFDDRDVRPGEKFADSDLIGIPFRVVVSLKTIEAGKLEVKERNVKDSQMMTIDELLARVG